MKNVNYFFVCDKMFKVRQLVCRKNYAYDGA